MDCFQPLEKVAHKLFFKMEGERQQDKKASDAPGIEAEGATEATGIGGTETPPKEL